MKVKIVIEESQKHWNKIQALPVRLCWPPTKCSQSQKWVNGGLIEEPLLYNTRIHFGGKVEGSPLVLNPLGYFGLLWLAEQCTPTVFPKDFCKLPAGEVTLPLWHDSCRPSVTDWNQACAKLLYLSLDCLIQRASFRACDLAHLCIQLALVRCGESSCGWMVFNSSEIKQKPNKIPQNSLLYQQVWCDFCEFWHVTCLSVMLSRKDWHCCLLEPSFSTTFPLFPVICIKKKKSPPLF